jgi:hypothetical protein
LLSDCKAAAVLLLRVDAILIDETKMGDDRPLWCDEDVRFARLIRHGIFKASHYDKNHNYQCQIFYLLLFFVPKVQNG